jgi:glycosyltransferase involved in cell wall biosynthesis
MRILFATQVDLAKPHGAARHVSAVAKGMAKLGHRVTLLSPGNVELEGVEHLRPRADHAGARMEIAMAQEIAKRADEWDVAYVRLSASTSAVPAALAMRRVPFAIELNGPILEELERLGRSKVMIAAARATLSLAVRGAEVVVAASENVARHASAMLGAKRIVVIENGADLEVATPGDRKNARRRLGLPEDRPILAMAGSLVPELRLDLLEEAHRSMANVLLVIAGDGPHRHRLDEMVSRSSAILALGPRPHEEAIELLRAADVCLNVRDGDIGMKGLEIAAVGRRQVAFRMEGSLRLESLYPGLEAVFLVGERTAEALKRGISAALEAEERLGPLPAEAVERARARLGWDHKARRLTDLLARVAQKS